MSQKSSRVEIEVESIRLKRLAARWRNAALALAALLSALAVHDGVGWLRENFPDELEWAEVDKTAPAAAKVEELIAPLRYSGFQPLTNPAVSISIDPAGKTWALRNIRTYDAAGEVTLDQGRYGICGELAAFTYPRVKKILGPGYAVQVIRASESSYFPVGASDHYLILITDLSDTSNVYALDPSFHRYGPISRFKNYAFYSSRQSFLMNHGTDMRQSARVGLPLLIRKGHLMLLSITPNDDGAFDAGNHTLKLTLFGKNEYQGSDVLVLERRNGVARSTEDDGSLRSFLGDADYGTLRRRITELFDAIPANSRPR